MEKSKFIKSIILGIVFWLIGALSVKLFGDFVFTENSSLKIGMFALIIPVTYLGLITAQKMISLKKSEILRAVAVMTFSATLLDGIALTWFRQIYANTFEISHYGAAWILWGGGIGLWLGYLMTRKRLVEGKKLVLLSFLGAVFWFVAVMIVRIFGASVFTEASLFHVLFLFLTVPLSLIFIFITVKSAELQKSEFIEAVSIVTGAAMLLDGIALTWFRGLYSEIYEVSHHGAAMILFGVGVGLLTAYLMSGKKAELTAKIEL